MAIFYDENAKTITLETKTSSYQMKIGDYGFLLHTYYGKKIARQDMSYLIESGDCGFSPNPWEAFNDRTFSADTLPLEYSFFGAGDFRKSCMSVTFPDGSSCADFRYSSYKIYGGKYGLPGLPAMYGDSSQWETLEIRMKEIASQLELTLYYGVMEEYDIITRACCLANLGDGVVRLNKALSLCLDLDCRQYDLITFYGRHTLERNPERRALAHGLQGVESLRGASSHQQNPFVILCSHDANEREGECFGSSLLYSGNFLAEAEVTQRDHTRLVMGIHPENFSFSLNQGERFTAPEAALSYSCRGFSALSSNYHRSFREHLCRGKYKTARRPVLINSWEAAYFDFHSGDILDMAREAAGLGIELLVLDDGWFGKRDTDLSGLGDWRVNEDKIIGGLNRLAEEINGLGMKFGLWFEPEMVSEDSDLYRAHPDWALKVPGRYPCRSRYQLVLDFSRQEVRDHIYSSMEKILNSANIEYLKWDMNRHLTDVWSAALPPGRQGEVYHRYVLGLYEFLERLNQDFPQLLIEGCAGGGGRFDAGMLYYTPQIWCSDNTDAADRLKIQYGTSFGYPISAAGSHVSVCPNHQTGRIVPLKTRGITAMSGAFGYELDPRRLTKEEKDTVREQIKTFKEFYDLIQYGDYYRLSSPYPDFSGQDFTAWQFVSRDKRETLLNIVTTRAQSNALPHRVKMDGLLETAVYEERETKKRYTGAALMYGGFPVPLGMGDYEGKQAYFKKIEK